MMQKLLLAFFGLTAAVTLEEGVKWLADKEKEEGVHKLPSGLLFKVLRKGDEEKGRPFPNTPCECHYAGTLPLHDGKEFDSSYKRGSPTKFAPNQVIKGWTEAMQQMHVGEMWEMYIHPDIAYGSRDMGTIPSNSVLQFKMEIISCEGKKNTKPREQEFEVAPGRTDL